MPFVYYGGKKGSAHRYPPPAFPTIIEPFAGSAGYALAWAKPSTRVMLVEKEPDICDIWRRLQSADAVAMLNATKATQGDPVPDLLVSLTGGGSGSLQRGGSVSSRAARDWDAARRRLITALPLIRTWTIIEGDYTDAPDVRATWFVDPPYCPRDDRAPGRAYGSDGIDYEALGRWCRSRPGQVIVCEQEGAEWLPFRPLFAQWPASGKGAHAPRVEMIWSRTPGTSMPGTARTRTAQTQRLERKRARAGRG